MDEDDLLPGAEDEIGLSGEVLGVETVAVAHAVGEGSDQHFGLHAS